MNYNNNKTQTKNNKNSQKKMVKGPGVRKISVIESYNTCKI